MNVMYTVFVNIPVERKRSNVYSMACQVARVHRSAFLLPYQFSLTLNSTKPFNYCKILLSNFNCSFYHFDKIRMNTLKIITRPSSKFVNHGYLRYLLDYQVTPEGRGLKVTPA